MLGPPVGGLAPREANGDQDRAASKPSGRAVTGERGRRPRHRPERGSVGDRRGGDPRQPRGYTGGRLSPPLAASDRPLRRGRRRAGAARQVGPFDVFTRASDLLNAGRGLLGGQVHRSTDQRNTGGLNPACPPGAVHIRLNGQTRPAARGNLGRQNRHTLQSGDCFRRCQPPRKRRCPKCSSVVSEADRPPPTDARVALGEPLAPASGLGRDRPRPVPLSHFLF